MGTDGTDSVFSRRASFNLVTEVLYVVVSALIGLLIVPYYIDELGVSAYAIIPLATSVSSYVMIFSDAFCGAVNRFFVVSIRKGDILDSNKTYSTSLVLLFRMALIVMPLMAIIAYMSPLLFNGGGEAANSVRLLFLGVFWSAIIFAIGSTFNNALIASNKLHIINTLRIVYVVLQIVIVLLTFTAVTPSLEFIGIAYMISATVYLVASYAVMKRECPYLKINRDNYDKKRMKDIGDLGVWSIANRLSVLLFLQASLIVANLILGAEAQGHFSLIVSLVSMVGTACMAITNVFYPFYYESYSRNDLNTMANVAKIGIKVVGIMIAFPLAYACVFAPEALTTWVGSEFVFLKDVLYVMFAFLVVQYAVTVLDVIPTIMLNVKSVALMSIFMGILNVIFACLVATYTDWGIIGIALVWTITMTIRSCILYIIYIAKSIKSSIMSFMLAQIEIFALFLCCVGIIYLLSIYAIHVAPTYFSLIFWLLLLYIPYLMIVIRFGLNRNERTFIVGALPEKLANLIIKISKD